MTGYFILLYNTIMADYSMNTGNGDGDGDSDGDNDNNKCWLKLMCY